MLAKGLLLACRHGQRGERRGQSFLGIASLAGLVGTCSFRNRGLTGSGGLEVGTHQQECHITPWGGGVSVVDAHFVDEKAKSPRGSVATEDVRLVRGRAWILLAVYHLM